jgi:hypothetical protein
MDKFILTKIKGSPLSSDFCIHRGVRSCERRICAFDFDDQNNGYTHKLIHHLSIQILTIQ